MPRARLIPPDFWTTEAVVDCAPMTRLLLLGLSTFADDFGVLPLRPRTLRLQVFPGDAVDDAAVGAMLDELAARGLVQRYTVEGATYLSIVDWAVHQRVGRRARRRYPADPSVGDAVEAVPADDATALHHSKPSQTRVVDADSDAATGAAADARAKAAAAACPEAQDAAWRDAIEAALRRRWGADVPSDVALHAARWRADGRDLAREVLPAVGQVARAAVECNTTLRLERVDRAMHRARLPAAAMAPTIANHGSRPDAPMVVVG